MQNQGIKFNLISKEKAKEFLSESNYFFKLKTFVKNYDKDKKGKYIKTRFCISKRNKYYRHFIKRYYTRIMFNLRTFAQNTD